MHFILILSICCIMLGIKCSIGAYPFDFQSQHENKTTHRSFIAKKAHSYFKCSNFILKTLFLKYKM